MLMSYNNENLNHLQFRAHKIKFYDEDLKKMETMSLEEKIEFKSKLKEEHRYTYAVSLAHK